MVVDFDLVIQLSGESRFIMYQFYRTCFKTVKAATLRELDFSDPLAA